MLSDRYFEIVRTLFATTLDDYGIERYFAELNVQSTARFQTAEEIGALYWL